MPPPCWADAPLQLPHGRCSGSEAGSYLRLIDSCITQLKAQGPARTCHESKEEEKKRVPGNERRGVADAPPCGPDTPLQPRRREVAAGGVAFSVAFIVFIVYCLMFLHFYIVYCLLFIVYC